MDKEKVFIGKLMELCTEHGKAYEFDCPNCGNYAMGFLAPNGKMLGGSCATCKIAGRYTIQDGSNDVK